MISKDNFVRGFFWPVCRARLADITRSFLVAFVLLASPLTAEGQILAQATDQCDVQLGKNQAVRSRLQISGREEARLSCGSQSLMLGVADSVEVATFAIKGDRLVLLSDHGHQRLFVFRKNPTRKAASARLFAEFEVTEQSADRAIVSMKAFEERGAVVIWRRGGP